MISFSLKSFLLLLVFSAAIFSSAAEADFEQVDIDENFYPYLTAKKRFMQLPGLKEFVPPDGKSRIIVCITSTDVRGKNAKALANMIKVCRVKAQVELLKAERSELSAFQKVEDRVVSTDDGKEQKLLSLSSYLDVAEERVKGVVRTWPVVGTWYSKDKTEFYLAIGIIIPKTEKSKQAL